MISVTDIQRPCFLITVDTEGDNLWSRPSIITTRNAQFLSRFQSLSEKFGFRPTYLVNYEMAQSPFFQEFGQSVLKKRAGEIGMHLHAWNTPPVIPLTENDFTFQPYLIEYPKEVMQEKVKTMTGLLEDTFDVKVTSHRAGRWSFNETYAQILADQGYLVDCSVTPYVSWKNVLGDPNQGGGTDFSEFPNEAYFPDPNDIKRQGELTLLEIPMTIMQKHKRFRKKIPDRVQRKIGRVFPEINWFRPNGKNLKSMINIMDRAIIQRRDYIQLMLHSSELMPGGSPVFSKDKDIEKLYNDLEVLFQAACKHFIAKTITEYYYSFCEERKTG